MAELRPVHLQRIAGLMSRWELLQRINFRDHNPEYRRIIAELEARVDQALGFAGAPALAAEDDEVHTLLKAVRNRLVRANTHAAIGCAIGTAGYPDITARLRQALHRESAGWPLPAAVLTMRYALCYARRAAAEALRRWAKAPGQWREHRRIWAALQAQRPHDGQQPVLIMTPIHTPHVGVSIGRIIEALKASHAPVVCALVDGTSPAAAAARPGWEWVTRVETLVLPSQPPAGPWWVQRWAGRVSGALACVPQRALPTVPGLRTAWRRDACELALALHGAQRVIERVRPCSVLNMAADKYLYSVAINRVAVARGIPVHAYTPMVLYPAGMYEIRPTASTLVASRLDIPAGSHAGRRYTVVGTPLFLNRTGTPAVAPQETVQVFYLTKRDFPNCDVIQQIQTGMAQAGRRFHLTIKPHPNDARSAYEPLLARLGPGMVTLLAPEDVDGIEERIAGSDLVITAPSNAIWQAFHQRKPVMYLQLPTVSAEHYPAAYARYAPGPFEVVRQVSGLAEAIERLVRRLQEPGGRVDEARYRALLADVFDGGRFDAAQRIAQLLHANGNGRA